jgi:hypothetical protein
MGAKLGALPHDDGTLGHVEYLPERVRWREKKEAELMRRIISLLAVMVLMVAMIAVSAMPAFARGTQGSECGDFVSQFAQTGELGQAVSFLARDFNFGQGIAAPNCNPN